jgi:hypothetical protein
VACESFLKISVASQTFAVPLNISWCRARSRTMLCTLLFQAAPQCLSSSERLASQTVFAHCSGDGDALGSFVGLVYANSSTAAKCCPLASRFQPCTLYQLYHFTRNCSVGLNGVTGCCNRKRESVF